MIKNAAKRDDAGAVCNSGMGILFFMYYYRGCLLFDEWVDHVVKELNIEDALKSSILVVQKAAAPKNGVTFCQGSIGIIRSSLAMSYDVSRRRACVWELF